MLGRLFIIAARLCHYPLSNTFAAGIRIIGHQEKAPPLALDPVNGRFAVAGTEAIVVVQLDMNLR
jgi:hypothetical protein